MANRRLAASPSMLPSQKKDVRQNFGPLVQLLCSQDTFILSAICDTVLIKESTSRLSEVLVEVFESQDKLMFLLQWALSKEIEQTPNSESLFRGMSGATRLMRVFIRQTGKNYLEKILQPVIEQICFSEFRFEVDATRAEPETNLDENLGRLVNLCKEFLTIIFNSVNDCPMQLRKLLAHTQKSVESKFPNIGTQAIGGFFFLRFICPAVASPESFGLVDKPPHPEARRGLILISKVLQVVANGNELDESKEEFMWKMQEFIVENVGTISTFFKNLTDVDSVSMADYDFRSRSQSETALFSQNKATMCVIPVTTKIESLLFLLQVIGRHSDEIKLYLETSYGKQGEEVFKLLQESAKSTKKLQKRGGSKFSFGRKVRNAGGDSDNYESESDNDVSDHSISSPVINNSPRAANREQRENPQRKTSFGSWSRENLMNPMSPVEEFEYESKLKALVQFKLEEFWEHSRSRTERQTLQLKDLQEENKRLKLDIETNNTQHELRNGAVLAHVRSLETENKSLKKKLKNARNAKRSYRSQVSHLTLDPRKKKSSSVDTTHSSEGKADFTIKEDIGANLHNLKSGLEALTFLISQQENMANSELDSLEIDQYNTNSTDENDEKKNSNQKKQTKAKNLKFSEPTPTNNLSIPVTKETKSAVELRHIGTMTSSNEMPTFTNEELSADPNLLNEDMLGYDESDSKRSSTMIQKFKSPFKSSSKITKS